MRSKVLAFLVSFFVLLSIFSFARAQEIDNQDSIFLLRQQIEALQNQIVQLQKELEGLTKQAQELELEAAIQFTQTLIPGVQNDEVKQLQEFLAKDQEIYPEGRVTGFFGPLTQAAVKRFQEKHAEDVLLPLGLKEGTGIVGPATRAKLNEIYGRTASAVSAIPATPAAPAVPGETPAVPANPAVPAVPAQPFSITPVATSTVATSTPIISTATTTVATTTTQQITSQTQEQTQQQQQTTATASTTTASSFCTGLSFTLANNKITYNQGEFLYYGLSCIPAGTTAPYVIVQKVNPNGTVNNVSSADNFSSQSSVGFSTLSMTPGIYSLIACFSSQCSPTNPTADINFTVTTAATSTTTATTTTATTTTTTTITTSTTTVATTTAALLAPTINYFKWGSNVNPCRLNLVSLFKYQRASNSQSFNIYLNYPNQWPSTKYTYQIPAQDNVVVSGPDNSSLSGSVLDASGQTSWQWTINTQPASVFATGTYQFEVSVAGANGETSPSSQAYQVATNTLYDGPVVTSPGTVVTQLPLTISLGNTIPGLYYSYFIADGTSYVYAPYNYTNQTSITVSNINLTADKQYQIYVDAYDNSGGAFSAIKQKCASSSFTFASGDTTPPVISNVQASNITATSAVISWQTNENSNGLVEYGPTGSLVFGALSNASSTTSHQVNLSGLSGGATYYYKVSSADSAGNLTESLDQTFTTVAPATASIKTGTGVFGENYTPNHTFNFGTGNIEYSYGGSGVRGFIYSGRDGVAGNTNPPLYFANPTPATTTSCKPDSVPTYGYQGIDSICQFISAANYTFSGAESYVTIYDKPSSCYQGILLFRQNNIYGGIDPEDIDNSGLLHYRYWYEESGGSDFSSLCGGTGAISMESQLASIADAISRLAQEMMKLLGR